MYYYLSFPNLRAFLISETTSYETSIFILFQPFFIA